MWIKYFFPCCLKSTQAGHSVKQLFGNMRAEILAQMGNEECLLNAAAIPPLCRYGRGKYRIFP
jgi:hypothetical protein